MLLQYCIILIYYNAIPSALLSNGRFAHFFHAHSEAPTDVTCLWQKQCVATMSMRQRQSSSVAAASGDGDDEETGTTTTTTIREPTTTPPISRRRGKKKRGKFSQKLWLLLLLCIPAIVVLIIIQQQQQRNKQYLIHTTVPLRRSLFQPEVGASTKCQKQLLLNREKLDKSLGMYSSSIICSIHKYIYILTHESFHISTWNDISHESSKTEWQF